MRDLWEQEWAIYDPLEQTKRNVLPRWSKSLKRLWREAELGKNYTLESHSNIPDNAIAPFQFWKPKWKPMRPFVLFETSKQRNFFISSPALFKLENKTKYTGIFNNSLITKNLNNI